MKPATWNIDAVLHTSAAGQALKHLHLTTVDVAKKRNPRHGCVSRVTNETMHPARSLGAYFTGESASRS